MSLEGQSDMLGIDRQPGIKTSVRPGADPGVFRGQWWSWIQVECTPKV